jgi:hypothetical protein
VLAASLALALGVGCRREPIFTGMSDSTFVRAMVQLRRLPIGMAGDTIPRARQRDSILATLGVTAADVESTAVRLARDPERAAAIWRIIESTVPTPP